MKRPGLFDYLIGNIISVLALSLAAAVFSFQAWSGTGSWPLAVITIVLAGWGWGASQRLSAYGQWKRDWEATGGAARAPFRIPGLKIVLATIVLGALAIAAINVSDQPGMEIPVTLFWGGTLLLIGHGAYRGLRKGRPIEVDHKDIPVALLLAPPRQSPGISEAMRQLPAYVQQLL